MSRDSKAPLGAGTEHDAPPSYLDAMSQQPAARPPLPPRQSNARAASSSRSTRSILPDESSRAGKRTLLLIYIHGFLGNEMSFQSFPAHVHSLVSATLADTHLVHTKIYPRYKSRKAIDFARDDFSKWHATPF
ncbi:MAG: hypothetical protein M1819_006145 [Sarea resinae]|nr:MAG: hypothetical protein M1819_006145 [Sarea resinae]